MFATAGEDPVAAAIVERLAAEVLALAGAAHDRLGLDGRPVELLLGGGLFRDPDARLLGAIEAGARRARSSCASPTPSRSSARCCSASTTWARGRRRRPAPATMLREVPVHG